MSALEETQNFLCLLCHFASYGNYGKFFGYHRHVLLIHDKATFTKMNEQCWENIADRIANSKIKESLKKKMKV